MALRPDIGSILETQADKLGDAPFLTVPGHGSLGYSAFNAVVNRFAHGLRERYAVESGDPVAIMMTNCLEFCIASYALKKIGAVEVAINTDFRGVSLAHTLNLTSTTLALVDESSLEAILAVSDNLGSLRKVLVTGEGSVKSGGLDAARFDECLTPNAGNPQREVNESDLAAVLFTSGTTGPSKGCMLSHRYAIQTAETFVDACRVTADDGLYCPFPLYHIDAAYLTLMPALVAGARAIIGRGFSASRFWDEVRSTKSTIFDFMGATLTILDKQPPRPDDVDNPVRLAWGVPMPPDMVRRSFEERFGLRLVHNYGLTDGGVPCWESLDVPEPEGSCGIPRDPFDVLIVDADDNALPSGETGEITIRALSPDVTMTGYWGMPEQTAEVMRNSLLHTGDLGWMDADRHLFFVSRAKDVIRRRGQNISAWEVEQVVLTHDQVVECTALGVPSELSEDEVKAVVILRDGAELTLEELQEFCAGKMAAYMIPTVLQVVDEIPKTETGKPQRYKL
jgi:crotonobetaine/carnitine-CoA ligase